MPTYQYACRSCGHRFEVVQSMADDPLTACPECGKELRKVYAPPAIAFRGSGFYATDHGKRVEKAKDAGEGSSATKEKGGDKGAGAGEKGSGTKEAAKGSGSGSGSGGAADPGSSSGGTKKEGAR